jgi:uncharacterized membrane protein YbhN (UPF0104 family)
MNRFRIRAVGAIGIVVATVIVFIDYFATHPSVRHQLHQTSLATLALLLILYLGTVVALALINASTLRLCQISLGSSENLLLTAYTAVINFFGPLQSGPAFRAVYLKQKHKINLKNYALATFVYYFFYAAFSGLFLLSGLLKWWLLALIVIGFGIMVGLRRNPWLRPRLSKLDLHGWYYLALATLLQVSLVAAIYYTELRSVAPGVHLSQAIVYTGAANFALFVSITPGAIGFRESFLVFSRHLHHIGNATIVAANILDRAVYIVLLLAMAVFIFATHARRRLRLPAEEG